jgi:hypothetical protein
MSIYSNPASSAADDAAAYVAALLELLGDNDPLQVFRETPTAVERVLASTPEALVTVAEAAGKWSMREVVQHLADSELVGGWRLRLILAQDRPPLTGYDQDLWADRLRYRDADVGEALAQFVVLRRANLRLWERLTPEDLLRVGVHSERGEESLGHLRQLYAAHDLLHRRQLERIRDTLVAGSAA